MTPVCLALVPVREGRLPVGADEVVAEAAGRAVLVGSGAPEAAAQLAVAAQELWVADPGPFDPPRWATRLLALPVIGDAAVLVLPAGPDGRDLAPHLAYVGGRSLYAGMVSALGPVVTLSRFGDRAAEDLALEMPAVVTLVPGTRGAPPVEAGWVSPTPAVLPVRSGPEAAAPGAPAPGGAEDSSRGPEPGQVATVRVTPPDPTTMDLAEADFIVAGGMGLGDRDTVELLGQVAEGLGASLGATRVVTDAGWVPFERQIGTTGVAVDPRVYVAFGISGAVQHTSGLGHPDHVVSVNLDPSCPMMTMADLAIVSDAPAVVRELVTRLQAARDRAGIP